MSKIKVDIDRVNDLTPSFSQIATKVSNTTDKVGSIRSQIDYRIKARHGIGDQLYKISNELQTIEKNMKKLVSFLQNSMDKYAEAEEKIARQVPMLPNVIGKNNITIDANGKIQVMDEYAQFNTNRAIDPNTGEYLFTYEGQRQVLGGNSSGTPDAISQLVNSVDDLLYEIFLSDIVTLFDPSASDSERAIARASMTPLGKAIKVIKGAKVAKDVLDNSEDIAKTVDKAENIKNLSKSVDKTKEIQDKTISDLEVKQLGEYIKDLEKKQVDKGTGESVNFGKYSTSIDDKVKVIEKVDLPDWIRDSFTDGNYRTVITEENITFYRTFGGGAKANGSFVTTSPAGNRINAKIDTALVPDWKNTREFEAVIEVPKGQILNIGRVEKQYTKTGALLKGDGDQILLPQGWPSEWIKDIRKVPSK